MKDKTTAAILTFFLGGLGVHKFYLGESGLGIIYLLFCWTFIPAFIALIDFLALLLMPEDKFNAKYNPGFQGQVGGSINISSETSKDKAATLTELKKLYDSGIITVEEYEAKRRKILDSI
jgi:TM2 domain-containing membrane protein YozV